MPHPLLSAAMFRFNTQMLTSSFCSFLLARSLADAHPVHLGFAPLAQAGDITFIASIRLTPVLRVKKAMAPKSPSMPP